MRLLALLTPFFASISWPLSCIFFLIHLVIRFPIIWECWLTMANGPGLCMHYKQNLKRSICRVSFNLHWLWRNFIASYLVHKNLVHKTAERFVVQARQLWCQTLSPTSWLVILWVVDERKVSKSLNRALRPIDFPLICSVPRPHTELRVEVVRLSY